MDRVTADILIVGGGPAGMAAAAAASERESTRVVVVDDNPMIGGQIWRAELGRLKSREALKLLSSIETGGIQILNNASIYAAEGRSLLAETPPTSIALVYEKLILATGAREKFLPFPGWTLPNTFGAAGLQALVKGGFSVVGKRIVVGGSGPLLLVVAEYLKSKGARILAICEQTSNRKIDRFSLGLLWTPGKIAQGIALRGKLRGIPYYKNSWIVSAQGTEKVQRVTIKRFGTDVDVECDMIACGFHLVPNLELPRILGCEIEGGFVTVDDLQQTSVEDVYCAGEPTGIGGVEASIVEGSIAGYAATENFARLKTLVRKRARTDSFADALGRAFELREELKELPNSTTIVCRCEDVQYGKLKNYSDFRTAKLQTRCGMGPCQGRVCGPALEFLFGWNDNSIRPPIIPVRMENL